MAEFKDIEDYTPEERAYMEEMLGHFNGDISDYNKWLETQNDSSINSWKKALKRYEENEAAKVAPATIGQDIPVAGQSPSQAAAQAALAASTSTRKQGKETVSLNPALSDRQAQSSEAFQEQWSGVGNTKLLPNKPILNTTSAMEVVEGQFGTYINQSNDCTGGLYKGYGAHGHDHAGAIDICAGAGGPKTRAWSPSGGRCVIEKDFIEDAARIYISQKTDIDEAFGLVAGGVGNWTARSGVGIKADHVRVIAREGIKLVTKTDLANSQSGDINSTYGVDIIAGNDDTNLQPMVVGDNLMLALAALVDEIHRLAGIVDYMLQKQNDFNAALQQHDHQIPLPMGVMLYALPNAIVYDQGLDTMLKHFSTTEQDLAKLHVNLDQWKINFINPPMPQAGPVGTDYICSRWNKVN